ncbi:MAG: hypothetical protein U0904_01825 [Candidatus Nanopelagicales bacterium]|nr:hypothetical protein [Candidatus Nanopelagicales bacterium]
MNSSPQESVPLKSVIELIGVYRADGGAVGETKYVISKLLGTAHCALCDITNSPLRRRPAWDRMVASLGVPFVLLHLNQMPPDVAAAINTARAPAVLARLADGSLATALRPIDLEPLGGSVSEFSRALADALNQNHWVLKRSTT